MTIHRHLHKSGLLIIVLVLSFHYQQVIAQDGCLKKLKKVIEAYEDGTIDKVVSENIFKDCFESSELNKEDKIDAYKYMTLIYLYVNDNDNARKTMEEFMKLRLKSNPEYDPQGAQSTPERGVPEFLELYNSLKAFPVYYVGLRAGINFAQIETTTNFSIDQSNINRGTYKSLPGFDVALSLEFPFGGKNRRMSIMSEFVYKQQSYQYQDRILDFAGLTLLENQNTVSVPILFKYHFKRDSDKTVRNKDNTNISNTNSKIRDPSPEFIKNKVQPFIIAGASVSYLLSARADIDRIDVLNDTAGGGSRDPIEGTYDLLAFSQREQIQYALIAGGGFRFRNFIKSGSDLVLEARFNWGLSQQVVAANRGANEDFIYKFGYIDSDFRLHNFSINISYLIPKYNPGKEKKKK